MRDVLWRMSFTLAALAVLLLLGPGVSCNLDNRLLEGLRGPTPQSEIRHYLAAIAEGDRQAALALWLAPAPVGNELQARRTEMTEELLGYGPRLEYRVLDVEYLASCCNPDASVDPENAKVARFRVAISGEDRPETLYLFDIAVPDLASGLRSGGKAREAAGQARERWAIVDVYPQDATPLAWIWR
jgi:hypothetical protein